MWESERTAKEVQFGDMMSPKTRSLDDTRAIRTGGSLKR